MARSMTDQLASARARRSARPSPMRRANPGFNPMSRAATNPKACTNPSSCCSDCANASATRAGNPGSRSRNPYALVPPRFGGYWGSGWGGWGGWGGGWNWPYSYAYNYPRTFVAAPRVVRPHPSRVLAASVAPYYYGYNGWGGFASPAVF